MRKLFRLGPYFWNGLNGGLLGGAVAGIVIGVGYDLQSGAGPKVIPEIVVYALLVGAMTAIFVQLGIGCFRYLCRFQQYSPWFFNELTGGALGGMVGGMLVGALGGCWFGPRPVAIDTRLLIGGALVGSLWLSAAMVVYDSVGNWSRVFYACLIPIGMTALLVRYAPSLFQLFGIDENFFLQFDEWKPAALGGARLGAIVGGSMGVQIGLALLVYTRWQRQASRT